MTTEAIEAGGSAPPVHAPKPRRMLQPPKDEIRRQLKAANDRYDALVAKIDRDVRIACVKSSGFGLIVGVLLAWWAK